VRYTSWREPLSLALGDATTGKDGHTFAADVGWVNGVSFSRDGKRLMLVSKDGTEVEAWDAVGPRLVQRLTAPAADRPGNRNGYGTGLTADGREVWLQLPDNDLARWDATTFRELPRLAAGGNGDAIAPFALADGRTVLVACAGGWVRVFDRRTGRERPIPGRYGFPAAFALSPDGEFVAAGDASGRIDLLDPASGKPVRTLRAAGAPVRHLVFGPDGAVLGVGEGSWDQEPAKRRNAVRALWASDGKELWARAWAEKDDGAGSLSVLGFTAEDRAVVGHPGRVGVWDVRTGKERARLATAGFDAVVGPGGKWLAAGQFGEVVLFDLATGRERARVEVDPEEKAQKRRMDGLMAWSADGRTLVATLPKDHVAVLDPVAGRERTRFAVYDGEVEDYFERSAWRAGGHSVRALALAPDGKRVLAAALNGTYVALWDVRTGKRLAKLEPGFQVDGAAFSPDGKSAFTFGGTGLGYRWDVERLVAARAAKK
jgi:WD40 repeat protein